MINEIVDTKIRLRDSKTLISSSGSLKEKVGIYRAATGQYIRKEYSMLITLNGTFGAKFHRAVSIIETTDDNIEIALIVCCLLYHELGAWHTL